MGGSPEFSIVVPTYERPRSLAACLGALARLAYPRDRFEVVVADDGGRADLSGALGAVRDRLDVTLVRCPHGGAAATRNRGAERARGRRLAFTDDDCAPAPDWLSAIESRFAAAPDAVMVGGRTVNALADNVYAAASQLVVDAGYAHLNGDPERARFFQTCNVALPAAEFRELGGFDETFRASEDRELCARWSAAGRRLVYAREAVVHHAHALTWGAFWRQHVGYGRGAYLMQEARARRGWEVFAPDPRYYARLLATPFAGGVGARAVLLSVLLLASQVASAAGLAAEWRGRRAPGPAARAAP